jgi:hypothetical protein
VPDSEEYGILVHCFDKNRRTKICIHVQEFRGSVFLSIREFYRDRASGDWKPSPRGVTVPPDLYPELLQGVVNAAEVLGVDPDSMA